jgi:hypothetical protein
VGQSQLWRRSGAGSAPGDRPRIVSTLLELRKKSSNSFELVRGSESLLPPQSGQIKLAALWPQAPALWFAQAERTFEVKHVVAQFDRYCHVDAALPHKSIRLVAIIVESEPSETTNDDIKQQLVASHQLSDFKKAEILFQMPSELMAAMLETCPRGEEKTNLFTCIFLQSLPREIFLSKSEGSNN